MSRGPRRTPGEMKNKREFSIYIVCRRTLNACNLGGKSVLCLDYARNLSGRAYFRSDRESSTGEMRRGFNLRESIRAFRYDNDSNLRIGPDTV